MAPKKELTIVHHLDEIPAFATEVEEHVFWRSHQLSDELWEQAEPLQLDELPAPRPETSPVVIRLDEDTLHRARMLARRQHKTYQALLAELVTAALADPERRLG